MTLLIEREIPGGLKGYYHAVKNGKKYSVVDFGTTMGSMPISNPAKKHLFMGWEAMPLDSNDELDSDGIVRAGTWEELEKLL